MARVNVGVECRKYLMLLTRVAETARVLETLSAGCDKKMGVAWEVPDRQ